MYNSNIGWHVSTYLGGNAKPGYFYVSSEDNRLLIFKHFSKDDEYVAISSSSIKNKKLITLKFGGIVKPHKYDREAYVNPRSSIVLSIADNKELGLDTDGDFIWLVKTKEGKKK